jgi:hypothetical protein
MNAISPRLARTLRRTSANAPRHVSDARTVVIHGADERALDRLAWHAGTSGGLRPLADILGPILARCGVALDREPQA